MCDFIADMATSLMEGCKHSGEVRKLGINTSLSVKDKDHSNGRYIILCKSKRTLIKEIVTRRKKEESKKAGSRWESDPGDLPVLCH